MTLFLDSLQPLLPDAIREQLDYALLPEVKAIVDAILRLAVGAEAPANGLLPGWDELQLRATKIVDELKRGEHARSSQKRARDDDSPSASKRARTDDGAVPTEDNDARVFTLQSISVSAPVRKKVNINVHRSSIRLTNPSSHREEYLPIPLSALQRVFLLSTRGKSKPHWTVALLPSDIPAAASKGPGAAAAAAKDTASAQLVFGLDATLTTALSTSTSDSEQIYPKGQPSLTALRTFFSHLPIAPLEPTTTVFRSAAGSQEGGGLAGVEAYRGAKGGTLWFLDEGVLWDGKPCEFFALKHLAPAASRGEEVIGGVRTLSATGRTCSVIFRRIGGVLPAREGASSGKKVKAAGTEAHMDQREGEASDDEDEGVDVDFGMVDGREQEPIERWIKARRHRLGRAPDAPLDAPPDAAPAPGSDVKGKGKATANPRDADPQNEDTEDEEDEDFEADSSDEDSSGSDADSDASGEGEGGDGSDSDDEGDASDDATGDEMGAGGELDPKYHPLLRPGAMPRMSRAAVDAVVGMVEQGMVGGRAAMASAGSEDDEEDELDD